VDPTPTPGPTPTPDPTALAVILEGLDPALLDSAAWVLDLAQVALVALLVVCFLLAFGLSALIVQQLGRR